MTDSNAENQHQRAEAHIVWRTAFVTFTLFLVANLKFLLIWFPGPQKITEREGKKGLEVTSKK